ncbi:MAG: hypothetical protein K2N94_07235, partial [Lachnospiraceae bacterium]|nr:hypothetical protein [Lachnospiraceae bacterium]
MKRKDSKRESRLELLRRCIRLLNQADPGGTAVEFLAVIPEQAGDFLNIYLMAQVITAVTEQRGVREVIWLTAAVCGGGFLLGLLARMLRRRKECHIFAHRQNLLRIVWEKVMNIDYVHIEDPETHLKFAQVQYGLGRLNVLRRNIVRCWVGAVNFMFSLLLALPVIAKTPVRTDGFIGFLQSPGASVLLLAIIVAGQLLQQKLVAKKQFAIVDSTNQSREVLMGTRIRRFYRSFVFERYRTGKDVRIYDESGLILRECAKGGGMVEEAWKAAGKRMWKYQLITVLHVQFLPELLVSLFAIARAMTGMFSAGEVIMFILYFLRLFQGLSTITGGL